MEIARDNTNIFLDQTRTKSGDDVDRVNSRVFCPFGELIHINNLINSINHDYILSFLSLF